MNRYRGRTADIPPYSVASHAHSTAFWGVEIPFLTLICSHRIIPLTRWRITATRSVSSMTFLPSARCTARGRMGLTRRKAWVSLLPGWPSNCYYVGMRERNEWRWIGTRTGGYFLRLCCLALVLIAVELPVQAQMRNPGKTPAAQDDPIAFGHPLSFWLKSIRERNADAEMAFEAIIELGPEAWSAVPELTRIVAEPFTPIRIDRDSQREMHAKLLNIHLRAGAVDGLAAIGEAAASSAEAVIRWGLTLRTVAPEEHPISNGLLIDLIGIDVLERMRAAGAVAQFGPDAAGAVQKLLESSDNEDRKFSAAILNDAAVPIAADLMNSDSCKDRQLGLSILAGMWPVVAKDHLFALKDFLECKEVDPEKRPPSTIRQSIPTSTR